MSSLNFFSEMRERLNKAYSSLIEQYSNVPAIAQKLKTAQSGWASFLDSLEEGICRMPDVGGLKRTKQPMI